MYGGFIPSRGERDRTSDLCFPKAPRYLCATPRKGRFLSPLTLNLPKGVTAAITHDQLMIELRANKRQGELIRE